MSQADIHVLSATAIEILYPDKISSHDSRIMGHLTAENENSKNGFHQVNK